MAQKPVLSVVVPVYNEQESLAKTIDRLVAIPNLLEIIIVDDCSTDATPQVIADLQRRYPSRIKALRHEKNKGKTAGLNPGFNSTTGDIVIVQDADLEYDPSEIAGVIEPIMEGNADVVYGSRFMVKKAARVLYYYHYLAKLGCRMYEVPISYYGRTYEEGKKIGTIDGLYALWCIFKYNWFVSLGKSFRQRPQLKPFVIEATCVATTVDR